MPLRKIVSILALSVLAGCALPHYQEPLTHDFEITVVNNDGFEFAISEHLRAAVYAVPSADTTRPRVFSQVVEIQKRDKKSNMIDRLSCDLAKLPGAEEDHV